MAETSLTVNYTEVQIQLDLMYKRVSRETMNAAIALAFQRSATKIAAFIAKKFLSGQVLKRRTGMLARSVEGVYETVSGLPRVRVGVFRGPAVAYARMHEFGGVIKPVKAKSLAVPVGKGAITPSGVSKFSSPRNYPGELDFIPILRGNLVGILVDPKEKNKAEAGRMRATYLLLRRVKVKPRPFLRPGVMAFLPALTKEVGNEIRKAANAADR